MSNYMITGTWDDITLVCGYRHEEPIPMVIQSGPSSPFYACPKYHPENRVGNERACGNRLSLQDYTKMLEHLHQKIVEAEMRDEKINLANYEWKDKKGTLFKVLSHEGSKMTIQVYNKRAIGA